MTSHQSHDADPPEPALQSGQGNSSQGRTSPEIASILYHPYRRKKQAIKEDKESSAADYEEDIWLSTLLDYLILVSSFPNHHTDSNGHAPKPAQASTPSCSNPAPSANFPKRSAAPIALPAPPDRDKPASGAKKHAPRHNKHAQNQDQHRAEGSGDRPPSASGPAPKHRHAAHSQDQQRAEGSRDRPRSTPGPAPKHKHAHSQDQQRAESSRDRPRSTPGPAPKHKHAHSQDQQRAEGSRDRPPGAPGPAPRQPRQVTMAEGGRRRKKKDEEGKPDSGGPPVKTAVFAVSGEELCEIPSKPKAVLQAAKIGRWDLVELAFDNGVPLKEKDEDALIKIALELDEWAEITMYLFKRDVGLSGPKARLALRRGVENRDWKYVLAVEEVLQLSVGQPDVLLDILGVRPVILNRFERMCAIHNLLDDGACCVAMLDVVLAALTTWCRVTKGPPNKWNVLMDTMVDFQYKGTAAEIHLEDAVLVLEDKNPAEIRELCQVALDRQVYSVIRYVARHGYLTEQQAHMALPMAWHRKDWPTFVQCLYSGASPAVYTIQESGLHAALKLDFFELERVLLPADSGLTEGLMESKDEGGNSLLHAALNTWAVDSVGTIVTNIQILIRHPQTRLGELNPNGQTALQRLCDMSRVWDQFNYHHLPDDDVNINNPGKDKGKGNGADEGRSEAELLFAGGMGGMQRSELIMDTVEELTRRGEAIDWTPLPESEWTPLHCVCAEGSHYESIPRLVELGADPLQLRCGWTLFDTAIAAAAAPRVQWSDVMGVVSVLLTMPSVMEDHVLQVSIRLGPPSPLPWLQESSDDDDDEEEEGGGEEQEEEEDSNDDDLPSLESSPSSLPEALSPATGSPSRRRPSSSPMSTPYSPSSSFPGQLDEGGSLAAKPQASASDPRSPHSPKKPALAKDANKGEEGGSGPGKKTAPQSSASLSSSTNHTVPPLHVDGTKPGPEEEEGDDEKEEGEGEHLIAQMPEGSGKHYVSPLQFLTELSMREPAKCFEVIYMMQQKRLFSDREMDFTTRAEFRDALVKHATKKFNAYLADVALKGAEEMTQQFGQLTTDE